ncbi:histidine kinase dimerization/phosphoacceptor domain-containing protein, partial [Streptomyces sp. NPDC059650]|uniref:histidine kinase dimerization/phosphoacceptor domain-containing protein n=1 Tax=Streptomyces sp. NPDC059650 TaxID=3346896 RepID=UPI0036CF99E7
MTSTGELQGGAGRAGPLWWERPRSAVLDGGIAAVSAAECAAQGVAFAHETGIPAVAGALFGVLAGSVVLLRRRWPVAVVLVGIAVAPAAMGMVLGVVGLYTLAVSEVPRRITATLTVLALVATFVVLYVRTSGDVGATHGVVLVLSGVLAVALNVVPVLLGLYMGARRRLMESLHERADSLERELLLLAERAEERAEWARREERTRIAREMHDVVAHRVSLMVVHAAALQAVAAKDPVKAARNAALVGDMGRQALTELREMLGVLRSGGEGARAERAADVALAGEEFACGGHHR